jgi:hypothetical protein
MDPADWIVVMIDVGVVASLAFAYWSVTVLRANHEAALRQIDRQQHTIGRLIERRWPGVRRIIGSTKAN